MKPDRALYWLAGALWMVQGCLWLAVSHQPRAAVLCFAIALGCAAALRFTSPE